MTGNKQLRICVVGAGTRFLGGISYYTLYLVNALARTHDVSAILMRQLLPTRLYPGRERVGAKLTQLEYDPIVRVYDGVDWYWLPSMIRALVFLIRERPNVVVFQWWSGTVLHSYLLLALVARLLGARIVIEFHEVLDPGESNLALAQSYVRLVAPALVRMAHGFVVHSEYDRKLLRSHYKLDGRPVALIAHGPYNQYSLKEGKQEEKNTSKEYCNLLFLGLIRPYKGLDNLIRAFDSLPESKIARYRLTVVGETWEGCTEPASLIEQSRYRDSITFVNRYVSDEEVATFFAGADAVVFPYHRASTSGSLHIAMSHGLPVIVTRVGGLIEAVAHYEGAILTPPGDPVALRDALLQILPLCGKRYTDPHSWEHTTQGYQDLFTALQKQVRNIS
jgi:glycosyltransferase involved in cell wall biosynthesis